MNLPPLEALPRIPRDAEGPVFREPWEAEAFALAVALHRAGTFTWAEWAAALADEIAGAKAAGDPDLGDTYYRHWLAALEKLVARARLATPQDIAARAAEIERARARDHGHDHDHDHDHGHDHDHAHAHDHDHDHGHGPSPSRMTKGDST
ncbi:MAG: hypothetical protein RLZZ276_2270 [Pseudomonadota bacterium]